MSGCNHTIFLARVIENVTWNSAANVLTTINACYLLTVTSGQSTSWQH